MTEVSTKGRGWQGAVLKLLRADDFAFTVTSTEPSPITTCASDSPVADC